MDEKPPEPAVMLAYLEGEIDDPTNVERIQSSTACKNFLSDHRFIGILSKRAAVEKWAKDLTEKVQIELAEYGTSVWASDATQPIDLPRIVARLIRLGENETKRYVTLSELDEALPIDLSREQLKAILYILSKEGINVTIKGKPRSVSARHSLKKTTDYSFSDELTDKLEMPNFKLDSIGKKRVLDPQRLYSYKRLDIVPNFWAKFKLEKLEKDKAAAVNPNTPVSVLEKLAEDEESLVRRGVALNPNTPVSVLEKLAEDEESLVRSGVAHNPNIPVSVLEKLAEDEESLVRSGVAHNPNTPVSVLEKLAEDEESLVREAVAHNPNTPVSVLEKLAEDEESLVREAVAHNPNTPVSVLEKLAEDEESLVREAVAHNPNTPVSVLEKLAEDEESLVREAVALSPNIAGTVFLRGFRFKIGNMLEVYRSTDPEDLDDWEVRMEKFNSEDLPPRSMVIKQNVIAEYPDHKFEDFLDSRTTYLAAQAEGPSSELQDLVLGNMRKRATDTDTD